MGELRTNDARLVGLSIVDAVLASLADDLRVHVVIWDTHDRRHRVKGRDDKANRERMFFHLAHAAFRSRPRAAWKVFPDAGGSTDWPVIQRCLAAKGAWPKVLDYPLLRQRVAEQLYQIERIDCVPSHEHPLVQVADLFAGMGAYSRQMVDQYRLWTEWNAGQGGLFESPPAPSLSHRHRARFPLIEALAERSRRARLGVSLRTNGYLMTHSPERPLSFWHYTPQHDEDTAPRRSDSRTDES